jgi:signal transduction histidine kinase
LRYPVIMFRQLSIKHKLILLSVLASGSALILACGTFVVYDNWSFRDALIQTISTQARIVGANSAASLLFGDPRSASETLEALEAEPAIFSAGVYTRDGKLFASYIRHDKAQDPGTELALPQISPDRSESHRFEASYLDLARPIIFHNRTVGIVGIRADLQMMRDRQLRYFGIAAAVLVICVFGSIGVSLWFQQRISQPLLDLAATAKRVSKANDFSVRAKPGGPDEIGLLVETFNEMLSRIQEQNEELQKAHDELEQRVIERTAQLEVANKELESFSYSVSHDLRAPLRSIDGFSQALFEDYGDKLDEQGRSDLKRVRAATQRMAQLIDDILTLSRVSRGEIRHDSVDLSALVKSIAGELKSAEPERQVDLAIADGIRTVGDARLLRVVLDNLLRNAWKFTGKTSSAQIEFGAGQNNGKPVYFVRDNGAGFDMAYAHKLFGAFQRLHAATEFNGTGVGLATVQRIIHRHGGRVWAEAKVDQGATFYFTL